MGNLQNLEHLDSKFLVNSLLGAPRSMAANLGAGAAAGCRCCVRLGAGAVAGCRCCVRWGAGVVIGCRCCVASIERDACARFGVWLLVPL